MIKAYVLIQTDPGKAGRVVEALTDFEGVISADGVTGPYDAVALAEARTLDELNRRVIGSVQSIEGVIRTLPCTIVGLDRIQSRGDVARGSGTGQAPHLL